MSLTINLEIGHEASLRTKNTPEGFTHDWKIFVRGCDGANIHYYIEKVVFYLHETFQKPKRVLKEPPYAVKESGYAGFIIPIEIYLRNSGEPKKIKFSYDLSLQRTGPPLRKIKKEKYFFTSPPEDFKEKLLKGGAVVTSNSQEVSENKSILHEEKNQLINKPKLSGELPSKKPKLDHPPISNSFQELFGTPITKTSKAPEPKTTLPSSKENKTSTKLEKDKGSDKMKSKYSPQKEKEREREKIEKKEKKEEKKKDKERREKDRERSREKVVKTEQSPKMRSPSPKNLSPKSRSPVPQSSQVLSAEKYREKESKNEKDKKDRDEEEKKIKKEKKDKDPAREKEKHRDSVKSDLKNKEVKTKEPSLPQESNSPLPSTSETFSAKQEKKDSHRDEEKPRSEKIDKSEEKKHKHKKKDKNKKERREKDEKSGKSSKKSEKEKNTASAQPQSVPNISSTSSDVEMSESADLFGSSPKMDQDSPPPSPKDSPPKEASPEMLPELSDEPSDSSASSRDTSPMREDAERDISHSENDSEKKRKRASDSSDQEEPPQKVNKDDENSPSGDENMSDAEEQSEEDEDMEETTNQSFVLENREECSEYCTMDTETYNILHDLKARLLCIGNKELLQKVVNLISDTGNFEVSSGTFDFDLRFLDNDTINALLEMLPPVTQPAPQEPEEDNS